MIRQVIDLDLTDDEVDAVEAIEAALDKAIPDWLTPSTAARKAGITTDEARRVLAWMVDHAYAHTTGTGAWTHWHLGRAR